MVDTLVKYWQSIGPQDLLPGRQHFDPIDVWNLVPNIWMVNVLNSPPQFQYRIIGSKVVDYIGRETTGMFMHEVFEHFEDTETCKDMRKAVKHGRPRWRRGTPTMRYDKGFKVVEQVSLPLASDGTVVDIVLNLSLFFDSDGVLC